MTGSRPRQIRRKPLTASKGALGVLSRSFPGSETLTPREQMILAHIVTGSSSKEIARALGIAPRTVNFHRANLLRKIGAKNTAELVSKVLRE